MHSFVYKLFVVSFILSFGSCDRNNIYEEKAKSLDSLNGVVNSMAKELSSIDTVFLKKSIARFKWYYEFIELNVHDTITKSEADNLDHFFTSGKNLIHVELNRTQILQQSQVTSSQLIKLSDDTKKKQIEKPSVIKFTEYESNQAAKLIRQGYHTQQLFHASVEEFKTSLKGVELLIRSRNNGELPTIIKDSINL